MSIVAKKIMMGSGAVALPSDSEFNRVSFLSHFDGSNDGVNNQFTDGSTSNHTITANGNVTQGSFGPFARPDGELGVSFDGDSDYLQVAESSDFDFGTGDFTVEFFFFARDSGSYEYLVTFGNNSGATTSLGIYIAGGTSINLWNGGGIASSTSYNLNQWYHLAVVRASGTVKVYLDGSEIKSASNSSDISSPGGMNVGRWGLAGDGQYFNGVISNLRVVKGTAVYTGNFTAPTSKLTAITNTKLLTCQSNRFLDNSATGHTVTPYATSAVTAFGPFLTSAVYDAAVNGASAYFDGTGDYLTVADSTEFDLGTGNFTIEGWINPAIMSGFQTIFSIGAPVQIYSYNNTVLAYFNDEDNTSSYSVPGLHGPSSLAPINAWAHFAVVRNGNTYTAYVNGVAGSSLTSSDTVASSGSAPAIGTYLPAPTSYLYNGYISNLRLVKGTAVYTSNFTPTTAPLTAITNTKLLLNMADAQAIDSAAQNNLTLYGNAKISNGQARFGDTSMVFDETGDYVTLPNNSFKPFGTGDFTIECFARFATSTVGNGQGLFQLSSGYLSSAVRGPAAGASNTDGKWGIYHGTTFLSHGSLIPSQNTWYHVAYVRNSGVTKLYIDGTEIFSVSDTTNYTDKYFVAGGWYSTSFLLNGYIDEFRISHMARYTSNFTAPTEPFADKGQ